MPKKIQPKKVQPKKVQVEKIQARIVGTASYLPERVLTNADLEKIVETSDEWIMTRTGIKERRIAAEGENTSDMGVSAARRVLELTNTLATDIDLILVCTLTPDYSFPSTASLIQHKLGAREIPAFDLQAACTGYIYGLSVAKAFVESGMYKWVLLVASEKLSAIVNYKDRNTCVLFGDGAAASLIMGTGAGLSIKNVVIGGDGSQAKLLEMPAGGSCLPASYETIDQGKHYITMQGNDVFKHAVRRMETAIKECLDAVGVAEESISWLVPHQANIRIIDALTNRFNLPIEKVYKTLQKYGNTSASSVAIALGELLAEQDLAIGGRIVLTAFGAGVTWGAALLVQIAE